MENSKFIDKASVIAAAVTLVGSFIIFFRDTNAFWGSLSAAAMTAGLVWATYIVLRWLLLANRN